ncbi:MAG: effector-associated domain EAD1-containing protein [Caldilineaceae bacterium]
MPLSGSQLDQIHRAIVTAYTRDELRRVVRVCMDLSYDDYAPDKGFADQLWALIEWAVRQDRVKDLIRCAHESNDSNIELGVLWQDAQTWDWTRQVSEPASSASTAPGHNTATLTGSGAIAQGGIAAGAGGIAIGGNFIGNINIGGDPSNNACASDDKKMQ